MLSLHSHSLCPLSGISLSAEDVEDLVTAVAGMTSLMRLELDLDNTSIENIDPLMAAVARLDNLRTLSVVLEHLLQVNEGWKIPWSSNNLEPLWSMPNLRSLSLDLRGVPFGQVDLLGKVAPNALFRMQFSSCLVAM